VVNDIESESRDLDSCIAGRSRREETLIRVVDLPTQVREISESRDLDSYIASRSRREETLFRVVDLPTQVREISESRDLDSYAVLSPE
jgi:hypothetical protein